MSAILIERRGATVLRRRGGRAAPIAMAIMPLCAAPSGRNVRSVLTACRQIACLKFACLKFAGRNREDAPV